MKTCFACNASVPDEYNYCLNCGRLFGGPIARSENKPLQRANTSSITTHKQLSRVPWKVLLGIGVAMVAFTLVINLNRRRISEQPAAGSSSNTKNPDTSPVATKSSSGGIGPGPKNSSDASSIPNPPGPNRVYTGREVDQKARLVTKPEPVYTEEARQNQITGTVVLKVVFASNGSIENIIVVSGLPFGLTERAIAAAKKIQFIPAQKDGVPVSMWMQLEYNFNLY